MTFDIQSIARNLQEAENGVWRTRGSASISYPDEHHDLCFAVEANSFWFRHRAKCVIQAIRNFPPDGVILDVGGGNGYMTEAINAAGFSSVLMEPGERGVHNATKRGLKPIISCTLDEAGFPDRIIPAIGLFDVVEHVEGDADFLRSVNDHLVPGGRLYLTVPAYDFLWSIEDEAGGHFRRYRLRGIADRLQEAGFEILYKTYFFSFLPLPILLLRTLPYRLGLRSQPTVDSQMKEHGANVKGRGETIEKMFRWELGRLKNNRTIPFGGSCLIAAESRAGD